MFVCLVSVFVNIFYVNPPLPPADIIDCPSEACDPNAKCTDIPGNFTCTCNSDEGFYGDGYTCVCEYLFYKGMSDRVKEYGGVEGLKVRKL